MTILDRYLIRIYVKVLLVSFLSLAGLYIVIDFSCNFDEFLTYSRRYAGGLAMVVADYYGPRLLWFFDRTAGLLAMGAAAFALTWLQRTNELTALFAAGVSSARVARPLVAASVAVALLASANREVGLPQVRGRLARNAQDWLGEAARKCTPKYDIRSDILIAGKATIAKERQILEPLFRLPPELSAWGRQIAADTATYEPATGDRPAGYRLRGVRQPADVARLPSAALGNDRVLLSPRDTPWLAADECFVVSVVTFEQLTVGGAWRRYLSTYELITGLRRQTLEPGADVRITLHSRLIQPLLDVALVLLGVPLVLGRAGRSFLALAVLGGGLVAAVLITVMVCHGLGANYGLRSAVRAAWLPLLLFGPPAYVAARGMWD